jgi:carbon storage regulator CsrA
MRGPNEQIRVGDTVLITVVGIVDGRAVIRVDAPPNVDVLREEIYQRGEEDAPREFC